MGNLVRINWEFWQRAALARGLSRGLGGRPDPPLGVWFLVLFGPFGVFERGWGGVFFLRSVVSGCVPVFCGRKEGVGPIVLTMFSYERRRHHLVMCGNAVNRKIHSFIHSFIYIYMNIKEQQRMGMRCAHHFFDDSANFPI